MATKVAFPMPNVEYSLALGSSFAPEAGEEAGTSYAALRYDFRPASADLEQPGVLLLGKDNRVSLYLANSATCDLDVLLSGKYEPYAGGGPPTSTTQGRDCLDCIAMYDPTTRSFQLEALLGQYNTKHIRDAPPYRAPPDDLVDLSPGTSASAGPSMSPPSNQAARRTDTPRGSDDGGLPTGQQQTSAGQAHDRIAATAAAAVRNSKPPRPPSTGPGGRAAGTGAGAQGKKRQRDGAASGSGPAGSSLVGTGKKTSRLARASGPRSQEEGQGQAKRGSAKAAAAAAAQEREQSRRSAGVVPSVAAAQQGSGGGGEEDFDAELLDAFDTFDSFHVGQEDGAAVTSSAATNHAGGNEVGGNAALSSESGGGVTAAAVSAAAAVSDAPAAVKNSDCDALAQIEHISVPAPTLGHEEEDEEVLAGVEEQHQHVEAEEAPPSPPRARLVVDMMDDDDGFGYGGEEEDGIGLGIEYF